MDMFSVIVFCIICLTTTAMALRLPLSSLAPKVTTFVDISEDTPTHLRHKRSPLYLPVRANLTLEIGGDRVSLNLHRNFEIDVNFPLYITVDGEIKQVDIEDTQGSGLYQDPASGANFLLQRELGHLETHTKVFGTFHVNSKHYAVQPDDNEDTDVRPGHVVSELPSETLLYESANLPDSLRASLEPTLTNATKTSNHHRHRRQSTVYKLEVLFVTDYQIYRFWLSQASNSQTQALSMLRQYYAYTFNGMDLRYRAMTGASFVINILSAGMYVATTYSDSSWSESIQENGLVDNSDILDTFMNWVLERTGLPDNDHAMGFTSYNLGDVVGGQLYSDSVGIARTSTLCTQASVSVVEDKFNFRAITTAAHELGHSLGAQHDGAAGNACDSNDNYIMATRNSVDPSKGQNLWIFSRCSLQYFQTYISMLPITTGGNCMLSESSGSSRPQVAGPMAETYSPDDTCVYMQGPGSYVCRSLTDYSTLCVSMYCNQPGTNICYTVLPPEKTPCGRGKWCEMGQCVTSSEAPDVPDDCPLGDRPGVVSNGQTCSALVRDDPGVCYGETNRKDCCGSCAAAQTNIAGCEYGDRSSAFCNAINRGNCYFNENDCCETCRQVKNTAFIGCEYGDKLLGCQKSSCDRYSATTRAQCCETCYDGVIPTTPKPTTPQPTTPLPSTPSPTTPSPTTPKVTTPKVTTPKVTTPKATTPKVTTQKVSTPTPLTPGSTQEMSTKEPEETGMPSAVFIGIGVGAAILVIVAIIIAVYCLKKRSAKKPDATDGAKPTKPITYDNAAFTNIEHTTEAPRHPPPRRVSRDRAPPAAAIVRPSVSTISVPVVATTTATTNQNFTKPAKPTAPIVVPLKAPSHPPPRRTDQPQTPTSATSNPSAPFTTTHIPLKLPPLNNVNQSEAHPKPHQPMKPPPFKPTGQSEARPKPQIPMRPPRPMEHQQNENGAVSPNGINIYADGYMMPSSLQPPSPSACSVQYSAPNKPSFAERLKNAGRNSPKPQEPKHNTKTKHYRRTQDLTSSNFENVGRKMSDTYDSIGDIQNMLVNSQRRRSSSRRAKSLERRPTLPANHPRERLSDMINSDTHNGKFATTNGCCYKTRAPVIPRKEYNEESHYKEIHIQTETSGQIPMPMAPPKPKPRPLIRDFSLYKPNPYNGDSLKSMTRNSSGNTSTFVGSHQGTHTNAEDYSQHIHDLQDTYDQADSIACNSVGKNNTTIQRRPNGMRETTQYSSIGDIEINI